MTVLVLSRCISFLRIFGDHDRERASLKSIHSSVSIKMSSHGRQRSSSSDMPGESPPPSGPSFSPTDETLNRDEEEFLK
ncbi:uncharacterized protein LOC4577185 isoform X5 [Anopheles gambiae]|uniref:uncharacterized protein LOC4577185 isoform X5 n=1 Tax=Anopheles gambiae TaxID=7165 RepID=UPI002AC95A7E|nr:uncharacterized protein LOC4577185 isoform X5 [Anopheles gambiae]